MAQKFVHLHVHSHYSLLDGLPKIPDLVARTKSLHMDAIALTDHGVLYGAVEFFKEATKAGIKPIIGEELYVTPHSRLEKRPKIDEVRYHLTVLVKNDEGYRNLVALTTKAHLEGFYYKPRVDKDLLRQHSKGLICLSGCLSGELARAIRAGDIPRAEEVAREHQAIFGKDNYYIEIWHHPQIPESAETKQKLILLAKKLNIPLVATHDVHYLHPEDKEAQDILVAVQTGARLDQEDRLSLRAADLYLTSPEEMEKYFSDTPEALSNSERIAAECVFSFELGKTQLPSFSVPNGKSNEEYLRELCEAGLVRRYGEDISKEIRDRLDFELEVIGRTGFSSYLLTVQDFVNWAKAQNIVVGPGRGSAAGSLVAYVLGITNIDPIKYELLFERFLNADRVAMPDIDLDFADTRRDEVIAYVREKYGDDHVAQIITFGTMAARAAVRDTGRALGLSYSFCDLVAKLIPFNPTQGMKEGWLDHCLKNVKELRTLYESNQDAQRLIDAARKLEGVARHASVHACGVVITRNPLRETIPLQRAPRGEEIVITQYEMHAIEDLGLLKMDFLGLRNLTIIQETLREIEARHGTTINIDEIPLEDATTFALLRKGLTTGVFQLESDGMKRYLKQLKPTALEDIIAMVSLYRPGPMELLPSYINRKNGKEPISYIHPALAPILEKTYGVGVYQEQMMQIARDLAGFTLSEADTLRKAIGKKIKKLLDEQKEKLISGMIKKGINTRTAEAIWELFPPFARYGFNRSHAACYALIAYQTAYLKTHYPDEFMAALLNAESSDVERIAFLTREARELGITVLPPEINESGVMFRVSAPKTIRFGLAAIKNVGSAVAEDIIEERTRGGEFIGIEDFLIRIRARDLNKKGIESLIKAGVFDRFEERGSLLGNIDGMLQFAREFKTARDAGQNSLFELSGSAPTLRLASAEPSSKKIRLKWEKELLGLYISDHPLSEVEALLKMRARPIQTLSGINGRVSVGGIIHKLKKIVTRTGQQMIFAELEDYSGRIEVIVFPSILEKNINLWQEEEIVLLAGKVQKRDNALKFICEEAQLLTV